MIAQITATTSADHPRPMALPRPHHSAIDRNSSTMWPPTAAPASRPVPLPARCGGLADLRLGQLDLLAHQRGDVTADLAEELADRGERPAVLGAVRVLLRGRVGRAHRVVPVVGVSDGNGSPMTGSPT